MWYVVQVETGREKTACDDIKQAADDVLDECFVPQYLTGKRRPDGTWIPSKERLFPGYLICGSVENVGVSRSGDAPPKATRANGESGR